MLQDYIGIDEVSLVGAISGARSLQPARHIPLVGCGTAGILRGTGLIRLRRIIAGDTYISAINAKSSVVCAHLPTALEVRSLRFHWLNWEEVPSLIEVTATVEGAKPITLDQVLGGGNVMDDRGFPVSELTLPSGQAFTGFRIRVLAGGKQNRLLLRGLEIRTGRQPNGTN